MIKGKAITSALILLVLISVVPHFTHTASGRVCNWVQYAQLSQLRNSENRRLYREGEDQYRIQTDKTPDRLTIRNRLKNKVPISDRLAYYLQQINITFGHAKDLIREAYRIAIEEENYTPEDAKNLLLENITIFSRRTIYSSLPDECKDLAQRQRRLNKRKSVAKLQPLSVDQRRGQITQFRLSGNTIDEFISYIGMIGKEDYCIGWIYDGELIDWEISPVLEGRMQVTDKAGRTNRRKLRLELEKNSIDDDSLKGKID